MATQLLCYTHSAAHYTRAACRLWKRVASGDTPASPVRLLHAVRNYLERNYRDFTAPGLTCNHCGLGTGNSAHAAFLLQAVVTLPFIHKRLGYEGSISDRSGSNKCDVVGCISNTAVWDEKRHLKQARLI